MVTKGYQEGVYERVTCGTICLDAHVGTAASAACPELRKVRRAKQSGFTWLNFEKGKAEAVRKCREVIAASKPPREYFFQTENYPHHLPGLLRHLN
jgi:hypothetical protein